MRLDIKMCWTSLRGHGYKAMASCTEENHHRLFPADGTSIGVFWWCAACSSQKLTADYLPIPAKVREAWVGSAQTSKEDWWV